jgi:cysteine-rich repeat protein
MLGALADNGGPTVTHAIAATSPAFDAGDPAGCSRDDGALLTTDQRGVTRPQFGRCDIGAFELACGNGTVDVGETCDDGGRLDGDCCSASCQLDENGSACNDGNACTVGNTCAEGVCGAGSPLACNACETCAPAAGCVANVRTSCDQPTQRFSGELSFAATGTPKVKWHWAKGGATTLGDFGDPLGGDAYTLCVFDESGATPTVLFGARTRAGTCGKKPCWKQLNASSLQYRDPELSPDGLHGILLKAASAGRSRVLLTGKGSALGLPTLPLPLPLRAQLQAENGRCWEGRYFDVGVQRNDGKAFKAKAYRP